MTDRGQPPRDSAGGSAAAKAESIRAAREALLAAQSPLWRAVRTITGPSPEERRLIAAERNWQIGADGERILAGALEKRCRRVVFLHDVAIRRTRANIDHIALAPSGVHVIDAKRYRGKIRLERSWLRGETYLLIAGRDRTNLIAGVERQASWISAAIAKIDPTVPVHGCLCFVPVEGWPADAGLPTLRTPKIRDVPLYSTRQLVNELNRPGPLDLDRARAIRVALAQRFPSASAG